MYAATEYLWCVHVRGCHILLYFPLTNIGGESHCSSIPPNNLFNVGAQF